MSVTILAGVQIVVGAAGCEEALSRTRTLHFVVEHIFDHDRNDLANLSFVDERDPIDIGRLIGASSEQRTIFFLP